MNKKIIVGIVLALAAAAGIYFYTQRYSNNVKEEGYLYIPTGASFQQIEDSIAPLLKNKKSFLKLARSKNLQKYFYPGRYTLKPGMNNSEIVQKIREGKQDDISIRVGNYSSINELAGKMAPFLESDSLELLQGMTSAEFAKNTDTANLLHFFLPNTYNFHWTTSGKQFADKMKKEFDRFWTEERKALAQKQNFSLQQATILASIVQLESAKEDEQPKVAGLYLNRLRMGMKLDADPTIIFIKKQQLGFTQKVARVYYRDLNIASPYNTYRNPGLPPSPICMPNPSAIDAVLKPAQHDFIYFVADPQKPGYHIFAKTLAEQEANAAKYRQWANDNNIK